MSKEPISAHGQDGPVPPPACDDGFDHDAHLDRLIADADAGRLRIPGPVEDSEREEGLSFIAAGPDELAALGVDALADLDVAGFAQGGPADVMPPGTVLLELAQTGAGTLPELTDNQTSDAF